MIGAASASVYRSVPSAIDSGLTPGDGSRTDRRPSRPTWLEQTQPSSRQKTSSIAVGRFHTVDRLGSGGMGTVYEAIDLRLDRRVAVKVPRIRAGTMDARRGVVHEARALAQVEHPHVVTLYELSDHAGWPFLVMELLEGPTLSTWARAQRPWHERVDVLIEIAEGIRAIHRAGVIHRDIKPHNVLMGRDGHARIIDFGVACYGESSIECPEGSSARGREDSTRALVGTPAYMAPEQFAAGAPTRKSDQFAFSVTAYELLYGRRPFSGDTPLEVQRSVILGRLERPAEGRHVPRRIHDVIVRGLSAHEDDRHPDMDMMLAELMAARAPSRLR